MHLEFGERGETKQAVHISRAQSADDVRCPYCRQSLVTQRRSGSIAQFAHTGQPCRYVQHYWQDDHIRVPLYGEFTQDPVTLDQDPGLSWSQQEQLVDGSLSLLEFHTLQEAQITQAFLQFQQRLLVPKNPQQQQDFLTDLKLFEWTQDTFTTFVLYFVEIQIHSGSIQSASSPRLPAPSTLYHLDRSDLPRKPYMQSLQQELAASAISPRAIRPLITLPKCSSILPYACFRFRSQQAVQYGFDLPAEYFVFSETSMPYALSDILQEFRTLRYGRPEHREKIKQGMQEAKASGTVLGRPKESVARFLNKKKSQEIAGLLEQGVIPQEIQRRTGYSINTIRKVNDVLKGQR